MPTEIRNHKSLVDQYKKAVRRALGLRYLGFDEIRAADNRLVYLLNGLSVAQAQAKYRYRVIPISESPFGYLWLGGSLEFRFREGKCYLSNASLLIFEGEATDDAKTPLLRAEWDEIDGRSGPHAQPHWHIYRRQSTRTAVGQITFETEPSVRDFDSRRPPGEQEKGPVDTWERFHFAMASRWHVGGVNAHQEEIDSTRLIRWVEGCLTYTLRQIEYIYR